MADADTDDVLEVRDRLGPVHGLGQLRLLGARDLRPAATTATPSSWTPRRPTRGACAPPRKAVPSEPSPSGAPAPSFPWRRTRRCRSPSPRTTSRSAPPRCAGPRPTRRPPCRGRSPRRRPGPETSRRPGRRWPPRAGSACTCPKTRAARASRCRSWPSCWKSSGTPCSPGRCCPRVLVSAALARGSRGPATVPPEWVRGLADGSITAAVALGAAAQPWQPGEGGALVLAGTVRPVLGLPTARLVLVPLDDGTGPGRRLDPARPGGAGRCRLGGGAAGARRHACGGTAGLPGRRPDGRPGRAGAGLRRGRPWPGPDAWRRPRVPGSPAGASRRRRSTPRCASSSAGPSASSRR